MEIKDPSHYQEITFEALHQLMEEVAKKGHSRLDISHLTIGGTMVRVLERKGFTVSFYGNTKSISW
jgi:hypothetical protein